MLESDTLQQEYNMAPIPQSNADSDEFNMPSDEGEGETHPVELAAELAMSIVRQVDSIEAKWRPG